MTKPVEIEPLDPKPFPWTPEQLQWLEALESGKYRQGRSELHFRRFGHHYRCCLGVACSLFQQRLKLAVSGYDSFYYASRKTELPISVQKLLQMRTEEGGFFHDDVPATSADTAGTLIDLNDSLKFNFKRIAAFIRQHPREVFTNGGDPGESQPKKV